jgi:hypothetical protein
MGKNPRIQAGDAWCKGIPGTKPAHMAHGGVNAKGLCRACQNLLQQQKAGK